LEFGYLVVAQFFFLQASGMEAGMATTLMATALGQRV
jgi:hypothetical protein